MQKVYTLKGGMDALNFLDTEFVSILCNILIAQEK